MKTIVVVGCGRQGADLVYKLQQRGHHVTVIDPEPENFEQLPAKFTGRTVVGVVFDHDILIKAGIERADGLAAMTNSDDANIVTALLARNVFHVPQVIARVYDPRQREIYRRLGLQTISPVEIATSHIVNLLLHAELEPMMTLGNGEICIIQSEIPRLLVGRTVDALTATGEIAVVAVTRGNRAFVPIAGTMFQSGDIVTFSVTATSMERLKQLLGMVSV